MDKPAEKDVTSRISAQHLHRHLARICAFERRTPQVYTQHPMKYFSEINITLNGNTTQKGLTTTNIKKESKETSDFEVHA